MDEIDLAVSAVHRAIAKRDRIIEREGDTDGMRREPWYLERLVQEQLTESMAAMEFDGRLSLGKS